MLITSLIVLGIGGGGFALFWHITRPKKIIYNALCYQKTGSIIPRVKDKEGNMLGVKGLQELKPYMKDMIEVVPKAQGVTIYRLQQLNISCGEVRANHIETWGGKKYVRVLVDGKNATPLDSGFDNNLSKQIFKPMKRERDDMITQNIILRKERNRRADKDVLAAIMPAIQTGLIIVGLLMIAWVIGQAHIKGAEIQSETADKLIAAEEAMSESFNNNIRLIRDYQNNPQKEVKTENYLYNNTPEIPKIQ